MAILLPPKLPGMSINSQPGCGREPRFALYSTVSMVPIAPYPPLSVYT